MRCVNHAFMHWSLTPWHKLVSAAVMEEITKSSLSQVGIYKFSQGETKQNNTKPPTVQHVKPSTTFVCENPLREILCIATVDRVHVLKNKEGLRRRHGEYIITLNKYRKSSLVSLQVLFKK